MTMKMMKRIKCQPKLRRRKYDQSIVGKITIESDVLEPGVVYSCTLTPLIQNGNNS